MSTPTHDILKSCPFCGSEAQLHPEKWKRRWFFITCTTCRCATSYCEGEADAIAAWNTRPAHPLSPAEAERIREALESLLLNYQQGHAACPDHQPDICMACRGREALALLEKAAGGQ